MILYYIFVVLFQAPPRHKRSADGDNSSAELKRLCTEKEQENGELKSQVAEKDEENVELKNQVADLQETIEDQSQALKDLEEKLEGTVILLACMILSQI